MDNVQLEREFGYRADAPRGKYVEKPPGMSFGNSMSSIEKAARANETDIS